MKIARTVLFYLVSWTAALYVLYYHALLQRRIQYWMAANYNVEMAFTYFILAGLFAALAGIALMAPIVWTHKGEGFFFNHRVFWPLAVPSLLILLFGHVCWTTVVGSYFMHFVSYYPVAGVLIGVAFGLALIIKREGRGFCNWAGYSSSESVMLAEVADESTGCGREQKKEGQHRVADAGGA